MFMYLCDNFSFSDVQDYVKIAKWKDVNYFAMKQAAEKSHRTLHKFVKNYEVSIFANIFTNSTRTLLSS